MSDTPQPLNLFDFIDFLESENPVSGTANENRLFIFNTLSFIDGTTYDPLDIMNAYSEVGINVPQSAFNSILDLHNTYPGEGNVIRIFAPTSPIPGAEMPLIQGDYEDDYITYFNATYINPITGDQITTERYLTYNDNFTPSQLRQVAMQDYSTKYGVKVLSIELLRSYQTFTTR